MCRRPNENHPASPCPASIATPTIQTNKQLLCHRSQAPAATEPEEGAAAEGAASEGAAAAEGAESAPAAPDPPKPDNMDVD